MWLKYKNIDFDYNERYITEEKIIDFIDKALDLALDKVSIYEISVADEGEDYFIYISKKGPKNEWDKDTIDYVNLLQKAEYEVMFADEDYGDEFDVIIIYND